MSSKTNNNNNILGVEDRLERSVLEHVVCSICIGIAKVPRQCPNGHTFCLECISTSIKQTNALRQNSRCPICKVALTLQSLGKSPLFEKYLDTLMVPCRYGYKLNADKWEIDETGCREITKYGDELNNHERECIYQIVDCQYKKTCGKFRKKDINEHYQSCRHQDDEQLKQEIIYLKLLCSKQQQKIEELSIQQQKIVEFCNKQQERISLLEDRPQTRQGFSGGQMIFTWKVANVMDRWEMAHHGSQRVYSNIVHFGGYRWRMSMAIVDEIAKVGLACFEDTPEPKLNVKCQFTWEIEDGPSGEGEAEYTTCQDRLIKYAHLLPLKQLRHFTRPTNARPNIELVIVCRASFSQVFP